MHHCKSTRSSLIELAMNELPAARATQLLTELKDCAACQEEYFSLRSVLRVSDQALRSTLPGESFWPGYHARLTDRLENYSPSVGQTQLSTTSRLWSGLRQIATASVRIPVPAAAAFILLIGISTFFAVRSRGQVNATTSDQLPGVETRTIQVPVVQEKVVTRVVYVEKTRRRSPGAGRRPDLAESPTMNRVAKAGANKDGATAISLVGFKPTDQVKLKIMKGSYHDEK